MFFKREMLNQNNEQKYFVKTIGYKLQCVIHGFTTTAIIKLISLNNIGPSVKSHFQLPSSLSIWSYRKELPIQCTITAEVYFDKTENQVCISLLLEAGQFHKSFTTHLGFVKQLEFITHSFSIHPAAIKLFSYILKLFLTTAV